ncbi:MAG TPA: phosphate ABC transporter substrate-binding protein PstS [Solirubrobacteraceae bacterium]|nr:phosphate ABC transporter substrate-binding protein PstS [Solirubrobacteraceae bacterium]
MLLATALSGVATASAGAANITGAGSTLVAPLLQKWKEGFEPKFGIGVTYSAVGSGTGIKDITARTVTFGASDAPLTPAQAGECNGCLMIPWALTATGVGYNVPGVSRLRLTGPVLAKIYLGQITNWDNAALKKINPGVTLPNLAITPVFRSDGSGDTYAFTNYLSDVSHEWLSTKGYSTGVSFTVGTGAKGNAGVSSVVSGTSGAIGYMSAAYLIEHGIPAAEIQNAAGKYEFPNLANIENAAEYVKKVPANNELHIVDPPKKYKKAYPISTFSYAIVPKATPSPGEISKFVLYAMKEGQAFGAALDFAPIPKIVLKAGIATAKTLT